jgi:glutamyl/glutaminyl-tRNA synthetase
MGWNDGTEQEIFTKDELIEKFSLDRVQKSGARFDEKRLLWMNGYWIRSLDLDDLYRRVANYWPAEAAAYEDVYKKQVLALAQDRLKTLAELSMMTRYFFAEPVRNDELITSNKQLKKLDETEIRELLTAAIDQFEAMDAWTPETIQETLNQLLETTGQKPGILFSLIRIAVTWAPFSPQLNDTLALLGRDRAVTRLKNF